MTEVSLKTEVQRPGGLAVWLLAARPKTLPAALVPVAVGTAFAMRIGEGQMIAALLCLGFAILVQIGTNFANDYFDFVKGADTSDRIGPTRVTAAGLVEPRAMRVAIAVVFGLAFLLGLNLVNYGGWWLVLVGLACIILGLGYTAGPYPLAYNSLGDLFVFIFFGLVAVGFTFYVQAGFFTFEPLLAGAAVGALATNLLVVNNLRDRPTDGLAGKNTLVVRFGRRAALSQYAAGLSVAFLAPAILIMLPGYGASVLLPLILAPVGWRLHRLLRRAKSGAEYNVVLAKTGAFLLAYGAFFTAGLLARF